MAKIGSWIGERYRILSQLGEGGTSTVYLVRDRQLQKYWAVKEISAKGVFIRQSRGVWNEINMLKQLDHPRIPGIVSVISQDQCFYVVMDYVKGRSLHQIQKERSQVSVDQIIDWGLQLCEVFIYLHSRTPPVIYRDLKPEHVLEKNDGTLMLVDFGILEYGRNKQKKEGVQIATPGFAPPEQCRGQKTDERSDLYSLGMMLYWLWKGRFPWERNSAGLSLKQADHRLERILRTCIKEEPGHRYKTVDMLQRRLLALQKRRAGEVFPRVCTRVGLFAAAFVSSVLAGNQSLGVSSGLKYISDSVFLAQQQVYESRMLLAQAEKEPKNEDKKTLIREAVKKSPAQKLGYKALFAVWKQDGVLDEEERREMEQMMIDVKEPLDGSALYGNLLYQVGRMYWYYYGEGELGMSAAVPWFEEAYAYMEDGATKELAALHIQIGSFYRDLGSLVAEGMEGDIYLKLWDSLGRMKELLWQEFDLQDAEQIKLQFAKLAVTASESYGQHWMAEGVEQAQILALISEVKGVCEDMEPSGVRAEQIRDYVLSRAEKTEQMMNGGVE